MTFEAAAWAVDQGQPITPQIHRILLERIVRADLKPGDRISEAEIARTYDVSRQPVREAFIKLSIQGLLEIRPQRGTLVSRISYAAVLDARFVREAIEADIVRLVARAPSLSLIENLRDQIIRQRMARAPEDFIHLDEAFHRSLAEAAGKGGVWRLVEGLKSHMDRVRYLSLERFPQARLIAQHETVVEAIAAGDVDTAETAIRSHLREVMTDLPEIMKANRRYFDLPAGGAPAPEIPHIQGGETG